MLLPLLLGSGWWVGPQAASIYRAFRLDALGAARSTKSACNELVAAAVGAHRVALVVAGGTGGTSWLRRRAPVPRFQRRSRLRRRVPVWRCSFFRPFVAAHQPFGCKREREGAGSCREAMATHTVASSEKTKASQVPSLASTPR